MYICSFEITPQNLSPSTTGMDKNLFSSITLRASPMVTFGVTVINFSLDNIKLFTNIIYPPLLICYSILYLILVYYVSILIYFIINILNIF